MAKGERPRVRVDTESYLRNQVLTYDSKSVDWRRRSTVAPDSWYKATAALLLPRPQ
jgi:hypothetical protein